MTGVKNRGNSIVITVIINDVTAIDVIKFHRNIAATTVTDSGAKMMWCGAINEITTSKNVISPVGTIAQVDAAMVSYNMDKLSVRTIDNHYVFDIIDILIVVFCRKFYFSHKAMLPILRQFSAEIYSPAAKWIPFDQKPDLPPSGTTPILYIDNVMFADHTHTRCIVLRRI